MIYDDIRCQLGEGPLWHPVRGELFWFDILGWKFHRKGQHWSFDETVSAAGWIDYDRVLMATQTALKVFSIDTGLSEHLCDLEADNPVTRSNDGRADPQGGFWIGTMGFNAEPGAGAIYRYFRGELRLLFANITISNAICFAPDGMAAYFCDTPTKQIMRVALNEDGWPVGTPEVHIDLNESGHSPDGAVIDANGNLWNAQWGSNRVACYDRKGQFVSAHEFPAQQTSCPAFGGNDLSTLFCTSAAAGLPEGDAAQGKTYCASTKTTGQAEHQVVL